MRNALLFIVTLFGATLCFGAEVYPNKPVRVVVGFSPGGFADLVARLISPQLGEQLGEPFVVDNRTGAAGTIATAIVAKSAPDGYTLLLAEPGLTINAALRKSLSYDVAKDFTPIVQIARVTDVLVVPPSLKINTIKEFIALAQANPGKLNFGSGGTGSTLHLYGELFNMAAKVNTTHVPYKGAAGTVTALLGDQIQMSFAAIPSVLQHVNSGRLRALAVTTDGKRSPLMPDVPSMSEAGIAGMAIYGWEGFIGPAGLPKRVVNKLHTQPTSALAPGRQGGGYYARIRTQEARGRHLLTCIVSRAQDR